MPHIITFDSRGKIATVARFHCLNCGWWYNSHWCQCPRCGCFELKGYDVKLSHWKRIYRWQNFKARFVKPKPMSLREQRRMYGEFAHVNHLVEQSVARYEEQAIRNVLTIMEGGRGE